MFGSRWVGLRGLALWVGLVGLLAGCSAGPSWAKVIIRGPNVSNSGHSGVSVDITSDDTSFQETDSGLVAEEGGFRVRVTGGPAFLGVEGGRLNRSAALALGLDGGLLLRHVVKGSAASRAGLKAGDVLILVGGESVETMRDLRNVLDGHEAGDTVRLVVSRKGQELKLPVVLGSEFGGLRHHGSGQDMVRFGESVVVQPGQVVEGDVVCIGGSAEVLSGAVVNGDVVAVGGSVTVRPGAVVHGGAVSVGSNVNVDPGAQVMGQSVSVHGPGIFGMPSGKWMQVWSWWGFVWKLVRLAIYLLLLLLLYALFKDRFLNTAFHAQQHAVKAFLIGLLVLCTLLPVVVLLCITLIGIPLAIGYLIAVLLAWMVGYLAVAQFIGKRLLGQGERWGEGNVAAVLVGLLFLAAFGVLGSVLGASGIGGLNVIGVGFKVIGVILWLMAGMTGLGAVAISRFARPVDPTFFGGTPSPQPYGGPPPGGFGPVPPGYPPAPSYVSPPPYTAGVPYPAPGGAPGYVPPSPPGAPGYPTPPAGYPPPPAPAPYVPPPAPAADPYAPRQEPPPGGPGEPPPPVHPT
jgi:hypothetical protein